MEEELKFNSLQDDDDAKTLLQGNENFCIVPWIHLSNTPKGRMRVCCKITETKDSPGSNFYYSKHNIKDWWNSDFLKKFRLDLLNNHKRPECAVCHTEEEAGVASKRKIENHKWLVQKKQQLPQLLRQVCQSKVFRGKTDLKPIYMDLRLGNKCNLRCHTCNPINSYAIEREWKEAGKNDTYFEDLRQSYNAGKQTWQDEPEVWTQAFELGQDLKELCITGGEPTLIEQNLLFLKELVKKGYSSNILLRVNTNMTYFPDEFFETIMNFKHSVINASIDAYGDMNSYIRYPSQWSKIEDNINKFSEAHNRCQLVLLTTVSNYNILHLKPLVHWFLAKKNGPLAHFHFETNLLHRPYFLQINLPNHLKHKAIQSYEELLSEIQPSNAHAIKSVISWLRSSDFNKNNFQLFKQYSRKLDQVRNTNFESVFGINLDDMEGRVSLRI